MDFTYLIRLDSPKSCLFGLRKLLRQIDVGADATSYERVPGVPGGS